MLLSRGLLSLVLWVACSGSESPELESTAGDTERTGEASTDPAPQPTSETEVGPTPSLPTDAMVQQMLLQRVIDDGRVQAFLHLELTANVPLMIHAPAGLDRGVRGVRAGGQEVRVRTRNAGRLVFTAREALDGPGVANRPAIAGGGVWP